MHVAASKLMAVSGEQVPADVVAKERPTPPRAAESKPANIVEKMVDGAVAIPGGCRSRSRSSRRRRRRLTTREGHGAVVNGFVLYVVGEGIEKKR
jgi:elongation factor Ts